MATKKYIYSIGRRKTSTAIVKLYPQGKGNIKVISENHPEGVSLNDFLWGHRYLIEDVLFPFAVLANWLEKRVDIEIKVRGWGLRGQAEAMRLGIARALVELSPDFRLTLKSHGLLKRDPRQKERKKPWLKKARRAPQWSKR